MSTMTRVRARYVLAGYLAVVLVLRAMDSARATNSVPQWTFWALDVPLSVAATTCVALAIAGRVRARRRAEADEPERRRGRAART